jgi:hypothetical protein
LFELGIKQRQIRREHSELARLQSIMSQCLSGNILNHRNDL